MSEDLQKLYDDAIKAMNAGENHKARNMLNRYLEADEENVEAWVALYKVVDDVDEKRICLTTILQLDPANSYARRELAKSEEQIERTQNDEEVAPGITRRMVRVAAIGGAAYVLVVFLITMLIVSGINGGKSAERQQRTQDASRQTATQNAFATGDAAIAMTQAQIAISQTAIAQSLITPSATFTRTPDPALATWTPTATESTTDFRVLEAPPAAIPGVISGWGGRDSTDSGYLNPIRIPANGAGGATEIINEFARGVTSNVPGQRVLFERYDRRLGDTTLAVLDPNNPDETMTGYANLWSDAGVYDIQNASMSADGNVFVVDALIRASNIREVFLVDVIADTLTQLTDDAANYSAPAISQDGSQVLAIKEDGANGTDLVLINVGTRDQRPMTTDGNALIESQPAWHSDNLQGVFAAHPQGQPNQNEIYQLRLLPESAATSLLIATTDADEIFPVYDPSSQFIAFASNRAGGIYNIYIFDIATTTTYQLTDFEFDYFPGGWSLS